MELRDERDHDYDGDAGDLLSYGLVRADAHVQVALREDGVICVWDVADDAEPGDTEEAPPTLFVVEPEELQTEAAAREWLNPRHE